MYRAERLDGKGKVEGGYFEKTPDIIITHAFYITDDESVIDIEFIKPETLEVFLFGGWRLVSELEKKYKLVGV